MVGLSRAVVLTVCVGWLAGAGQAWAQNYVVTPSSASYAPLTGPRVVDVTPLDRDSGSALIALGFAFPYYGKTYTHVIAHADGTLLFAPNPLCEGATTADCYLNGDLPSPSRRFHQFIAGWWDDLKAHDNGVSRLLYTRTGTELTVEWSGWGYYQSGNDQFSFQITLQSNGRFRLHYGTHSPSQGPGGNSASAGFEDATGARGSRVLACTPSCDAWQGNWPTQTLYSVGPSDDPDLIVASIALSQVSATASELTFQINPTFRNLGVDAAQGFLWKAYLSNDEVLDSTDTALFSAVQRLSVAGGQSIVATGAVTFPRPPPGNYYVLVEADSGRDVAECAPYLESCGSEQNNTGASSAFSTQPLDLVARGVSGPPLTGPGSAATLTVAFDNPAVEAAGTVAYRVYLSADAELDASDFVLHAGSVEVGGIARIERTVTITVPPKVPLGALKYLLKVDPLGAIAEASESNNEVVGGSVEVTRADLVIDQVELLDPVSGFPTRVGNLGEAGRAQVTLRNLGGSAASASELTLALSYDANLSLVSDKSITTVAVPALAAGQSLTTEVAFIFPPRDRQGREYPTGNLFLFALADAFARVEEAHEENNTGMLPQPVRVRRPAPDYAVTRMEASAQAGVGELTPVTVTLENLGNVAGGAVVYRFFASANDLITPDDVPLPLLDIEGVAVNELPLSLPIGGRTTRTHWLALPASMQAGRYFLGCIVDPRGSLGELDRGNNARASAFAVDVAGGRVAIDRAPLLDAIVDRPYLGRLSATGLQGPGTWWAVEEGGPLPDGLSLSADGSLKGTPVLPGVNAFTAAVTDGSHVATARLTLRVLPSTAELQVSTLSLPPAVRGRAFESWLGATGGVSPYRWRLIEGQLPSGVSLGESGRLAGTVAAATPPGTFPLKLELRDAMGTVTQKALLWTVLGEEGLGFVTRELPDGYVGKDYLADLAAQTALGKTAALPLKWSVVQGVLPPGLSLEVVADERGLVRGSPTHAGTFAFRLRVEDGQGQIDAQDFVMRVFAPTLEISFDSSAWVLKRGATVQLQLLAEGAREPRFRLQSGGLPAGLSLQADGSISGAVAADARLGTHNATVVVSDASGARGTSALALEVSAEAPASGCAAGPGPLAWCGAALTWLAGARRRRTKAAIVLFAALCLSLPARSETVGYGLIGPTPATYVPLAGGTPLSDLSSNQGAELHLGFPFTWVGRTYTTAKVSLHGYLAFAGGGADRWNDGIPHGTSSSTTPQVFLAPWWDELSAMPSTLVSALTVGPAGQRVLTVEWRNVASVGSSRPFSFQLQLFEATGRVRFAYGSTTPASGSASVGVQARLELGMPGLICTGAGVGSCEAKDFPSDAVLDFVRPADLQLEALGGDLVGFTGVSFRSAVTLLNAGGRGAEGVVVRFYLSRDAHLDDADLSLSASSPISMEAASRVRVTAAGPIPLSTSQGAWFLLARADPDAVVSEATSENNAASPLAITIGPPTPDLSVSSVSAPALAQAGGMVQLSRTLSNRGNAAAAGGYPVTYFLSDNATVTPSDRPLLTVSGPALPAGGNQTGTVELELPSGLVPGRYALGVCVDLDPQASPRSTTTEISELNNCAASSSLVISSGSLSIVTADLPTGLQFAPYGLRLEASGGGGVYAWTKTAGELPPGLTLTRSGDLEGLPSLPGSYVFEVSVASGENVVSRELALSISEEGLPLEIADQALPGAELLRDYAVRLVAIGGKPPYRWTLEDEASLPAGLWLSSEGRIEGQAFVTGTFPFEVSLVDASGASRAARLSLRVTGPASLKMGVPALADGFLDRRYLQVLVGSGGAPPYRWSVVGFRRLSRSPGEPDVTLSQLPGSFGLALEEDLSGEFVLRGAPLEAGRFAITLQLQDTDGESVLTTLPLTIRYEEGFQLVTPALPDAFVDHPYQARLTHNGGARAAKVRFSLACQPRAAEDPSLSDCVFPVGTEGLPPGLSLTREGVLEGSPTQVVERRLPRTYRFLVQVEDGAGRRDVRALSIKVQPNFSAGCSSSGTDPLVLLAVGVMWTLRAKRRRLGRGAATWALVLLTGCAEKNLCAERNVRCEAPLTCDPGDGECKCGGRGGTTCGLGFLCDADANTCLSTRCANVTCLGGTACDVEDGECKCGGTGGAICAADERCDALSATCEVLNDCRTHACPSLQTCDATTGRCQCGAGRCSAEQICVAGAGGGAAQCSASPCAGVACVGASTCDPADGYCKCNGAVCQAGQACECPAGSDGGSCAPSERACVAGSACASVVCPSGSDTTCDPTDGRCKCGGPGIPSGPVCGAEQLCVLGAPSRCEGGVQCLNPDGGAKECLGGTSCDPDDGLCKCGGQGGPVCSGNRVCVESLGQHGCRRPCDPRAPDCPVGSLCFFDSSAVNPTGYCAPPAAESRSEGQACNAPNACSVPQPALSLHCLGLVPGSTGICHLYCDVAAGQAGCSQVPRLQDCEQLGGAPAGLGYCSPR